LKKCIEHQLKLANRNAKTILHSIHRMALGCIHVQGVGF